MQNGRMKRRLILKALGALILLTGAARADEPRNAALRATVTASSTLDDKHAAENAADGDVPLAGIKEDAGKAWVAKGNEHPDGVTLTFAWDEPAPVASIVYYGRTTYSLTECFKDYEIYADDASKPVAKGAFKAGHGAQPVHLPEPVRARRLTLKFLSNHGGGNPGAAEVQVFTARPGEDQLLCRFTDFKTDFRFTYFPSHDLVRFLLPKPPAGAETWRAAVLAGDDDKPLAERNGELPMSPAGESLNVPDLPEGNYRLVLTLGDSDEPVVLERWFARRHFEWEGRQPGMEDVVVPPFTPLKADAARKTVDCVLRTHTMGDAGLWAQVASRGEDILAGPIRLEATHGGKMTVAEGKGVQFAETKDTRITGSAAWTAGPLTGSTTFDYDYDGFQQLTLKLNETDEPVALQLVIPLKPGYGWLMHPVTQALRQHYAGRVPAGDGKVWDSSGVPSKVGGFFVPYIYVGGPERGICFAADNDRDWIRGDGKAMMEIDRADEAVNLRLNLIGRPAKLTRERTLTFALQATPAKPMPAEPYTWRRWYTTRTARDAEDVQIRFWGGNMYWGGRLFATSVFPAGKDYTFWEKLAAYRRTGERDPEFEKEWLARFEDLPDKTYNSLRAHFNAGLSWAPGTPAVTPETTKYNYVIPYTNPRGANVGEDRDFGTTYIDEWQSIGIADPAWSRASAFQHPVRHEGWATWYHIEPVPSRVDMLLHYHRKMFETFADGIYWDNYFLRACYIPPEAGGAGYVADDGTMRPGVNLTAFRSLAKRTAVMMHTMGRRPLIYIHMTNTNIVPMLSFATLNLDWEWRDQGDWALKDLQDRLGVDRDTGLILAQSLGLKTGNISVAIDRFHPPKPSGVTREWLFRTVMAVCIPHEIKVYQGTGGVTAVQNSMAGFGYGDPGCKVYRYWDEDYPLQAEGANVKALVLEQDGKAMLAVGNYGPAAAPAGGEGAGEAAGPSLEEYDAGQRGLKKPDDGDEPDAPAEKAETYTVKLTLDLEALGLPEGARAYNVEKDGEELKRTAPGVFVLPIRHHDFALVKVE